MLPHRVVSDGNVATVSCVISVAISSKAGKDIVREGVKGIDNGKSGKCGETGKNLEWHGCRGWQA